MSKKSTKADENEQSVLDAYLASAPAPAANLGVIRPKAYRMNEKNDATLNPKVFVGTPGDLTVVLRYSSKMTAVRLADWQGDPETSIEYTYEGGPRPVVVRFGLAAGAVGLSDEKLAERAARLETFDPKVGGK